MAKDYYNRGRYVVTGGMVRAWNRSLQLSTVEGVDLGRPLFLMALGIAAGLAGLSTTFIDLLYPVEIAAFAGIGLAILALSWRIGALRIYSKLTGHKGWSIVGGFKTLRSMRDAIEAALADQALSAVRLSGGMTPEDGTE